MKRLFLGAALLGVVVAVVVLAGAASPTSHATGLSFADLNKIQKKLASGLFAQMLGGAASPSARAATRCVNPTGGGDEGDEADNECPPSSFSSPTGPSASGTGSYFPSGSGTCSERRGDNVKVNQNCENVSDPDLAGRGQAQNETAIAINPNDPKEMVASQNDYRRGDGNCYAAYTADGGHSWDDSTVPMSFTRGTAFGTARQYWQAGGDTSVAWDTKGNAYISCQMFNRGSSVSPNPDQSSAFYVFRSTGNGGASWNFPGRPAVEHSDAAGAGTVLEDKAYMTVDDHVGSPFQDRIYVTWTEFAADGTAYIYEDHSNDYGETFSAPVLVSGDTGLCPFTYGLPTPHGKCNENQFSDPFTGPDGALYVAWSNFNTATSDTSKTGSGVDNAYQILLAKSTDGGATFSKPVQVSTYYDLPDCETYQHSDPFRACVPEKGPTANSVFRATNYPSGAVDPTDSKQVVVNFGSYINQDSNEKKGCTPGGFDPSTGQPLYDGVKAPGGCNNDILISVSTDGGATFTGTAADPRTEDTVNPDGGQARSDQFWQWTAFNKQGKLAVSYYDRQYGHDEQDGWSDITLSSSGSLSRFKTTRVTSDSMPPPTQFGGQFYGDYSGLDAYSDAVPIWMDTRDPELFLCPNTGTPGNPPQICEGQYDTGTGTLLANDQNIYAATEGLSGR